MGCWDSDSIFFLPLHFYKSAQKEQKGEEFWAIGGFCSLLGKGYVPRTDVSIDSYTLEYEIYLLYLDFM